MDRVTSTGRINPRLHFARSAVADQEPAQAGFAVVEADLSAETGGGAAAGRDGAQMDCGKARGRLREMICLISNKKGQISLDSSWLIVLTNSFDFLHP